MHVLSSKTEPYMLLSRLYVDFHPRFTSKGGTYICMDLQTSQMNIIQLLTGDECNI